MGRILTLRQVLAHPLPLIKWLVGPDRPDRGGLVAEGERVMLVGESGSQKSWILIHLGLHLAAGRDWLGFKVNRPYRVLYVDEEAGPQGAEGRLHMLGSGTGVGLEAPFAMSNRAYFRAHNQLNTRSFMDWAKKQMPPEWWPPEVVMVDTMRATMTGTEDKSENIVAYWEHLAPLIGDTTVFLVHHMVKPPEKEGQSRGKYSARGSGRIVEDPDVVLMLHRPNAQQAVTVIEQKKSREEIEYPPFRVELVGLTQERRGPKTLRRVDDETCRLLPYGGA